MEAFFFSALTIFYLQYFCAIFNFTRTAALVAIAGYLLIFFYLSDRVNENIFIAISGSILVLFASMLRFESFLMISVFAFGMFLYEVFFSNKSTPFIKMIKSKIPYFVIFSVLFLAIFSCKELDNIVYQTKF